MPDEASGQLGSDDGGGAGVKAAEPTDWDSEGAPSEDGDAAERAAAGSGKGADANGPSALAATSSRGRFSAL